MGRFRRATMVGVAAVLLAACASRGADIDDANAVEWIPRYTREKPPQCPFEEVGSFEMRVLGNDRMANRTDAERLERRRALEKERDKQILSVMTETGADAIFEYRRRPTVFIRFTDPDCLE